MDLNLQTKYWWYCCNNEETDNEQCLATIWSDSWHDIQDIYNMKENDLIDMIQDDIDYYNTANFDCINKRKVGYAIKELIKLKEKYPIK